MTEQEKQICRNMTTEEKREVLKSIDSEVLFEELMTRHIAMRSKLKQIEEIMSKGGADETT